MKKIFFIGLLGALTGFTVHATDETKLALADNPPPYAENDFLAAFASKNVDGMLSYAENKKHDHLKRWAMKVIATAYEKRGEASFWLAQRLIKRCSASVNAPELAKDSNSSDKLNSLGKHYLVQASRLKCKEATAAYQEIYHENPPTSRDRSLGIFRMLIEKDFDHQQLYINQANQYLQENEPLKALAFTMIGLQKTKGDPAALSIMAARFAYPAQLESYYHYYRHGYDATSAPYKIFECDAKLASTYFPFNNKKIAWYPEVLLAAAIAHKINDFDTAGKFYRQAAVSNDQHSSERRRIEKILVQIGQQENPNAPIYQNSNDQHPSERRRIEKILVQIGQQENPNAPIYQNAPNKRCVLL